MSDASFRVELPEEGLTLRIGAEMTLMEAMRAAGVPLRHACRNGVCEVCGARLLSGDVWQRYPEKQISGAPSDAPLIFLCTSFARSDLTLSLMHYARLKR